MKGRVLVYGRHPAAAGEIAALLHDGRLDRLAIARDDTRDDARDDVPLAAPGAVFAARVDRVLGGGRGAFLDLGGETGFLPDAEVGPGDRLIVQVQSPAQDDKAARVSRAVSLRDRLLVFTPLTPGVNISRKITDEAARARLSAALAPFESAGGFILRTEAADAPTEALAAAATRLVEAWRTLQTGAPGLRRPAPSPLETALTEWPRPDQAVSAADADPPPGLEGAHRPVGAGEDPFELTGVTDAIDALLSSRCDLGPTAPGAWMALERTEALVAVDVNAGDAASMLAANLAAAREIPRQLRLRGWAGMAVIDFAGRDAGDRPRIEKALRKAAEDGLRLAGWGPLGLLEATRRREGAPIEEMWRRES